MNTNTMTVFDEGLFKIRQKRAQRRFQDYAFLYERTAKILIDRLDDIDRHFENGLEISSRSPGCQNQINQNKLHSLETHSFFDNSSFLNLPDNHFDIILSNSLLHWVNDVPGFLIQVHKALKPDGVFLACFVGGETLKELREIMMDVEIQQMNGASPRVSPFMDVKDAGSLLQRAGFTLPVTDREIITVHYKDPMKLFYDLRGMGGTNARIQQNKQIPPRHFFPAVCDLYQQRYGDQDGSIPVTVEILTMTGWKPHESQQKPLKPGSGQTSLTEVLS